MTIAGKAEDIAKRWGLEAIPENIRRLTQLVSRQDATTEELAKVIAQDKELTARLLRAANPRATNEEDYAVTSAEEALMRTGMGCALLLAMGDPLMRAVLKTFQTMLLIRLETVGPKVLNPLQGEHVLGEVGFSGKATGVVHLRLTPQSAALIASRMLGVNASSLDSASELDDVIGELTNIVVGNFKSNLRTPDLPLELN
jgi:chemotaxis protein CheX